MPIPSPEGSNILLRLPPGSYAYKPRWIDNHHPTFYKCCGDSDPAGHVTGCVPPEDSNLLSYLYYIFIITIAKLAKLPQSFIETVLSVNMNTKHRLALVSGV